MLGVFAELETNLRKERQMEGIATAKANGIYVGKGRPASIDAARVRAMKAGGMGATKIAKETRDRPGKRLSRAGREFNLRGGYAPASGGGQAEGHLAFKLAADFEPNPY
jgi:hypothetical protein